jgi:PKD repeat protein
MTDTVYKLAVLAFVVALVGASFGHVPTDSATVGYFTDNETAPVTGNMPEAPSPVVNDSNPVAEGQSVNLTGEHSTDDTGIETYEWDFDGDGTIDATGVNQEHTFTDQGEYTVTVIVTDTTGLEDSATTTVSVHNVPPTARVGSNRGVDVDEQVTFDASGTTDPGDDELQHQWDVDGDGEYETTGVSPTHTYGSEGTYAVTMHVSDGDGGADTANLSVNVQNVPPTAEAGGPLTVVTGEPALDGSGSVAGDSSDTLHYEWDVDDDGDYEVTGATPSYYYTAQGTYNVTLKLSDGDGGVNTDTTTVTVDSDTTSPTADIAMTQSSANNTTVSFDATGSTDNARIIEYQWEFGDGTTANGATPTHSYDQTGTYNVTVTVTDPAGNTDTKQIEVTVESA